MHTIRAVDEMAGALPRASESGTGGFPYAQPNGPSARRQKGAVPNTHTSHPKGWVADVSLLRKRQHRRLRQVKAIDPRIRELTRSV